MKIVHIIDSLGIGGAEQLLAGTVKELDQHDHTVVYLHGENAYVEELNNAGLFCLEYYNRLNTLSSVRKLKRILKSIHPDVIHSHLPTATYLTRLANHKKCKHYFTVHNNLSETILKKSKITWFLEKWLYNKNQHAIFVSKVIKKDYEKNIGLKGPYSVLYNYADKVFFELEEGAQNHKEKNKLLRFVSVGTLKEQKNHLYLIESFAKLPGSKYQLDIIGSGPRESLLKEKILELKATNVHLRMSVRNLQRELKTYDFFVLASKYEGFGIASIEAMALGIPLILSDLEIFREISHNYALFFDIYDSESLKNLIRSLPDRTSEIKTNIEKGRIWVREMYSIKRYTDKLLELYSGKFDSE